MLKRQTFNGTKGAGKVGADKFEFSGMPPLTKMSASDYAGIGETHYKNGKFSEAATAFFEAANIVRTRGISIKGDDRRETYFLMAIKCMCKAQDYVDAKKIADGIIRSFTRKSDNNWHQTRLLGEAYFLAGTIQYEASQLPSPLEGFSIDGALEFFTKAVDSFKLANRMSNLYLKTGNMPVGQYLAVFSTEISMEYSRIDRFNKILANAYICRANCYASQGGVHSTSSAEADFQEAVSVIKTLDSNEERTKLLQVARTGFERMKNPE